MKPIVCYPEMRSLYYIIGHEFQDNEDLENKVMRLIDGHPDREKILIVRHSIADMVATKRGW